MSQRGSFMKRFTTNVGMAAERSQPFADTARRGSASLDRRDDSTHASEDCLGVPDFASAPQGANSVAAFSRSERRGTSARKRPN